MENREEVVPESQQYAGYDINQRNGELSLNQSNPACSNVLYNGISVEELKKLTLLRKSGVKIYLDLSSKPVFDHEHVDNSTSPPVTNYAQQGQMQQMTPNSYAYPQMTQNTDGNAPFDEESEYY